MSAASDRLSEDDYRELARISRRVDARWLVIQDRERAEAEARERAGEGGEGGEHDAV